MNFNGQTFTFAGRTVRDVARQATELTEAQIEAALDPFRMTGPR